MTARTIAKIQTVFFTIILSLATLVLAFVTLGAVGMFHPPKRPFNAPPESGSDILARLGNDLVASPKCVLVTLLIFSYVGFCVWLCKRYANEAKLPLWLSLMTGILPGYILAFSWSGFIEARKIICGKFGAVVNSKWILITLMAGGGAISGFYYIFISVESTIGKLAFNLIFFASLGLLVLSFLGSARLLRRIRPTT